jgi:23S rRNA pseudouridine1911/1915/1917 synthase
MDIQAYLIFADDDLLVLNKPSGIHSALGTDRSSSSIAKALGVMYPELSSIGTKSDCGLANRLDFETSGVLIAARSQNVWNFFREAFRSHSVEKRYVAIVEGNPTSPTLLHHWIGSPYRRGKKVKALSRPAGQPGRFQEATSNLSTISYSSRHDCSIVSLATKTGARHQIRMQMKMYGHPLVGDSLYGSRRTLREIGYEERAGFFLHAESVQFLDWNEKRRAFSAPTPVLSF